MNLLGKFFLVAWWIGFLSGVCVAESPLMPAPPSNDDLCDAIPLTVGAPCAGFMYTTIDATVEDDEYYCSYVAEKSVWFSFVAPETGAVVITTARELPGSTYLTRMLYEEDDPFDCTDLLTILDVDCSYDGGFSDDDTLTVCSLSPGETYYVQIFSEDDPYEANFCIEIASTGAYAGSTIRVCEETTTMLDAFDPDIGTGMWTLFSGDGTITDPSSPSSGVTGLEIGGYAIFQWTVTDGYCSDDDYVYVFSEFYPSVDAGPDQTLCQVTSAFLDGNEPLDFGEGGYETGLWTSESIPMPTIVDATFENTEVLDLVTGTSIDLVWSITNVSGACTAADTMTISIIEAEPVDAGPDQLLCDDNETTLEANTPISGTGLWTVLSGPVDVDDPSDPNSLVSDLGFSGTSNVLEWSITDGECVVRDTVTITYGEVIDADAGPDQYLCEETMTMLDGNSPIEGDFGFWTLLGGTATIVDDGNPNTDITGLVAGDTITLEWYLSNEYCTTYDTVVIYNGEMVAADAGDDQGLCDESSTTLAATPPVSGSGMWSVDFGDAVITDPTSPTSTVTGLAPGYSFASLLWTVTSGGCADFDYMYIIVDLPPAVDAGPDQELCDETVTVLDGSPPQDFGKAFETGLWTINSGSCTIADPTLYNSSVSDLIPGSTVELVWTITSDANICMSSDTMTITIYELPTVADAGMDQVLCETETTTSLAGNTPSVGTGMWAVVDGIATLSDPMSPTTMVSGIDPGIPVVVRWTISNGTCPTSMDEMTITFDEAPSVADAGPDQELCDETMTMLAANTPLIGTGQWYLEEGTATIDDPTSPTSTVTGMIPGDFVLLTWEISNGVCPVSFDEMFIYIDENPTTADAGPDQDVCGVTSTFIDGNIPSVGYGLWSVVSGTGTIDNPESPSTEITGMIIGSSVTLEWTIENGSCPPSVDQLVINVDEQPTIADAGPDQELCDETMATLSANAPLVGTGTWTVISGTATITDPASPVSGVTDLIPGQSVVLEWSISNGICPVSSDQMEIINYELPTIADAGMDQQMCDATSTFLEGNSPSIGTGLWTVVNGIATITDPENPETEITDLLMGDEVTLEWTISNGVCPETNDQVTITVDELPTVADAGPDQELCNVTTTFLDGNVPEIGTGVWTVVVGVANLTDPMSPTSEVTDLIPGESVTLEWSIENGTCPVSTDQVVISVDELPTDADAGPDQQFCNQTETTLEANSPAVGSGLWTIVNGNAFVVDPEDPETDLTELMPGTEVTLQWQITNGVCAESSDEVTIRIDALPSNPYAGPDQLLCDQLSTLLEADEPIVGIGQWSILDGVATIVSPGDPNSELTDLVYGTSVSLEWTITNETCPPASDHVIIDVEELPTEADAGPDQMLCGPTSTFLEGNTPVVGEGYWLKISGPGIIVDPELPNSALTGLEIGMPTVCQWTIFGVNCPASSDNVTIETFPGGANADAGPDQQICNETSVFMAGNLPMGTTGEWTVIMGTATIIDATDPMTEVTGFIQGETVVLQWAITPDGCSPSVDQMNIFVNTSGFVEAGPDQDLCDQISTTLSANTPDSGEGVWHVVSGVGTVTDPMSPVSTVEGLGVNGTLILEWVITDEDCLPSRDTVTIINSAPPSAAMAGDDQDLCASASTVMNATAPLTGIGMWTLSSGTATITDPMSPGTEVLNLIVGETVVLKWTVANGACPSTEDEVLIINELPPSASLAGDDQVLCTETETQLSANTPDIGEGTWSLLSGTGTIETPTSPVSMLTNMTPGTIVVLEWSISNGTCPPERDTVEIQWHSLPSEAFAGDDQFLCKDVSTILEATPPVVGEGFWSIISGVGTITDPSSPNSELTDLVEDASVVLHWTVTNAICPPSIDDVTIRVDVSPSPALGGPDFKVCEQKIVKLAAEGPAIGEGEWSVISGSGLVIDPTSPTSQVTNLVPGTTTWLQWSVTNGACEPNLDTIFIEVDEMPTTAFAGDDQQLCGINVTMLEGNIPTAGQGVWSIENGSGTLSDPMNPSSMLADLMTGNSVTLSWTISNGVCPSTSDEVLIEIGEAPTEAMAGDDQSLCDQTETSVDANMPIIGMGAWEIISGSGTIVNPGSPSTQITDMVFGDVLVIQWVITEGNCVSYDTLTIFPDQMPTAADAGEDQVLCATETTLSANMPVSGTGEWSIVSGSGVIEDPFAPESMLTGIAPGATVVLSWTITSTCGSSSDEVTISATAEQPIADGGSDQVLCNVSTTQMNATPANIGSGTWSIVSGAGSILNTSDTNAMITDLVPGTSTVLRWTVESPPCMPAIDDVTIQIDEAPSAADAGDDVAICDTVVILSAENPLIGSGQWQIISGTGMLNDPSLPNATLSDLLPGAETVLAWHVSNGVCPALSDTIAINATSPLTTPDAGADEVYCNLPVVYLHANVPEEGVGEWTIISGSGVLSDPSDPNTGVTSLGIGDNAFVWTISNNACTPLSDTVILTNTGEQGLEANFLVSEIGCVDTMMYMFDISENEIKPTGYLWDFGDNTTSMERDPVHTYTTAGNYTITMTTFLNGCASAPASKDISVFACAFSQPEYPAFNQIKSANVFPNPTDGDFNVSVQLREENETVITIYQADGQLISSKKFTEEKDIQTTMYAEAAGCYFVRIAVQDEVLVFKVLKIK